MQEKHEKKEEIGMRIAVCDDEKSILEEVSSYIIEFAKNNDIEMVLYPFQNANDLENEINNNAKYDIVLLDIEIGNVNGIELAKKIKKRYETMVISFISGHEQYVYEAFDVQPCGFIKKPIQKKQMEHVLEVAISLCKNMTKLTYSIKGKEQRIYLRDIYYVFCSKRKIILKTVNGDIEYYGKISDIEQELQMLDDNFIRISSYMIANFKYADKITYREIILEINGNKKTFSITQSYRVTAREKNQNRLCKQRRNYGVDNYVSCG